MDPSWTSAEDEALRATVEKHGKRDWEAITAAIGGRNHEQYRQRWKEVLKRALAVKWSSKEDSTLERTVLEDCYSWEEIAARIPGRTAKECRKRWQNYLDPSTNKAPFTQEEDITIQEAYGQLGNRWAQIVERLPGRTEESVKARWKVLCRFWWIKAKPSLLPDMNASNRGPTERPETSAEPLCVEHEDVESMDTVVPENPLFPIQPNSLSGSVDSSPDGLLMSDEFNEISEAAALTSEDNATHDRGKLTEILEKMSPSEKHIFQELIEYLIASCETDQSLSVNTSPFTPEEDATIQQMSMQFGSRWTQIADLLPGRTEDAVKMRWKALNPNQEIDSEIPLQPNDMSSLRDSSPEELIASGGRDTLLRPVSCASQVGSSPASGVCVGALEIKSSPTNEVFQVQDRNSAAGKDNGDLVGSAPESTSDGQQMNPAGKNGKTTSSWTPEQDEALRAAVEKYGQRDWKSIAVEVEGRNHAQCLQRWNKVLKPGLVNGHWSYEEDSILERMVLQGCHSWAEVSAHIPGRTAKQCRERWRNHLDPSINKAPFAPEEDITIQQAYEQLGNRWTQIAELLPGRTEDAVKMRWKALNPNQRTNAKPGRPRLMPDTKTRDKEGDVRAEPDSRTLVKELENMSTSQDKHIFQELIDELRRSVEADLGPSDVCNSLDISRNPNVLHSLDFDEITNQPSGVDASIWNYDEDEDDDGEDKDDFCDLLKPIRHRKRDEDDVDSGVIQEVQKNAMPLVNGDAASTEEAPRANGNLDYLLDSPYNVGFLSAPAEDTYGSSSLWMDPELLALRMAAGDITVSYSLTSTTKHDDTHTTEVYAATLLSDLTHPNILPIIGLTWNKALDIEIITPMAARGDLRSMLNASDPASLIWADFKYQVAIDVVSALAFLHQQNCSAGRGALTSWNVLLDADGTAKLNLVRLECRDLGEAQARVPSPLRWIAPEVVAGRPYTSSADMYALGVLLTELDTTKLPFEDAVSPNGRAMDDMLIAMRVVKNELRPPLTPTCPDEIAALVGLCLLQEPTQRPRADQVVYQLRAMLKDL